MSFRFHHSGDSSTPTAYELSNGQSLDFNAGDSLKLTNPEEIADMVPQGQDVLVMTKDGSSYLLKNFLLAESTELELPDGTTITADNFQNSLDDASAEQDASGLRGINFEPDDASGNVVLQSVTLLSIISALSQNTSAFDGFKLNEDGEENPELRNYFQTLTLAAMGKLESQEEQAHTAQNTPQEEQFTSFRSAQGPQVQNQASAQAKATADSENGNTRSVTVDVSDTLDTDFLDLTRFRVNAVVVDEEGNVVDSETIVDEENGTVEVVVDIGEEDAGKQVEIDVVVTDPTEEDKVIDRSELTVVLPDPFNNENVTLSLSGNDVLENEAGYTIGSLEALGSEKEIEGPFTYSILSDPSGLFEIEGSNLKLKDGTSIDFETAPESYGLTLRIENEEGTQIDRALTLKPADANDAPEIAAVDLSGTEDASISFERETFEQAFSDVDGDDTLQSVRIDSLPENGSLTLAGETIELGQTISVDQLPNVAFQPNENWNGHTDFQWSGFDGADWSAQAATVSIDIENINDAPVATFSVAAQTANEDAAFSFTLPENLFSDIDAGDTLTLSAQLPSWLSFNAETGEITGVPSYQNVGEHRIQITATDSSGEQATTSFTLEIENVNDRPTFTQIQDVSISEYDLIDIDAGASFSDEDGEFGDSLTYAATLADGSELPDWISIDAATGKLTGTPPQGQDSDIEIKVSATDTAGESVSNTFSLHVENQNDAPELDSPIADQSADEDSSFSFNIANNFSDSDLADQLTYTATLPDGSELPDWLSFDSATGQFSGTPGNDDVGMLTIQVTASDGSKSADDFFAIMVENTNDKPVATAIVDQAIAEDSGFSLDVSDAFSDVDAGDTLTYSATQMNGSELPEWLTFDETTGKFSGTPDNDDVGSLSILVVASDGTENANAIFSIEVENTNDGPVATFIPEQTATEDAPFLFDASDAFSDVDAGDELTYSATLADGSELPEWLSINPLTGELSGNPENAHVGELQLTVSASDGQETASASLHLSVENTNDGPVVSAGIEDLSTAEDAAFSLDVSSNFGDPDFFDTLSFSATLEDGSPLPDWLSFDPFTASFSGTPRNADVGSLSVRVVADDGEAAISDVFTLEVQNTNDGPVVTTDFTPINTDEDSAFSFDAASHFSDIDTGDTLTYSAKLSDGSDLPDWISIDPITGELSGIPDNSDVGKIRIQVTATDESGESASGTFTLEVVNTNDGPLARPISDQAVSEDATFNLDVLDRFSDLDSDDNLTLDATLEDGSPLPTWLEFDAETGTFSGTPENGDVGALSINVTATDESGSTVTKNFGIQILNTNDGPIASEIEDATASEDAEFTLDVSGSFSDVDQGDSLTFSARLENGDPLPSWLSFNSETGSFSGTPTNADVSDLQVTVTASDGSLDASQTFTIAVQNTNDGPTLVANLADRSIEEDSPFSLDASSNFADVDLGDTLSYSATLEDGSALPAWLSINETTGELSGTPENGDVGTISVTVTATDTSGSSVSDTLSIQVENTNDGPVASQIDDQSAHEDSTFTLDASTAFHDVDTGDTLSYSATLENGDPLPSWLSIDSITGELSGTPENEDVGQISVKIIASDGVESASSAFTIEVVNTNDGPTASAINDQSVEEDSSFNLDVSSNFSDIDPGDELVYEATLENGDPLPAWLSFDEDTGVFSGTPENGDVGELAITVIASDGESIAESSFSIQVSNTNDGPTVSVIADQSVEEDSAFSLDASANFSDADAGDILTYSATLENGDPLPSWLSIDAETGLISGTPENGDVGNISVTVTATDEAGSSASDTFSIQVENTNDGPTVSSTKGETLWQEDFSGLSDGSKSDAGDSAWTTDDSAATATPNHGVADEA
ncbi:putative Ig domain-containing protein, partial [Pelagicoccus sp. SDUM812005]|uniref:putative Ig domain-containing protein n=1 Tax=Pelagicoccus sp. SDUM812005 TaxID=3041257 RepID=UPI00280E7098